MRIDGNDETTTVVDEDGETMGVATNPFKTEDDPVLAALTAIYEELRIIREAMTGN